MALITLVQKTSGDLLAYVDAAYVIKGHSQGPRALYNSNAYLWELLWKELDARPGKVTLIKTKAHADASGLRNGLSDVVQLSANYFADAGAGEGADRNAVPYGIASTIAWVDARIFGTATTCARGVACGQEGLNAIWCQPSS